MKITMIGAGRVATHLVKGLHACGYKIHQVYSRNLASASELASTVNACAVNTIAQLDKNVDLVILAISDQAIEEVAHQLSLYLSDVLMVHTSGSTALNKLSICFRRGVFYPLQTFSLEKDVNWQSIPILLEANSDQDLIQLKEIARNLSNKVYCYDSAQRLSLHLAAVFACNFSNYCYDIAHQITQEKQVDFSLLHPLILETAQKATVCTPKEVQTGPAKRHDEKILQLHEHILESDLKQSEWLALYCLMSEQIKGIH